MLPVLPGLYLGWGIGANDAANTFGPQIGANVISYRRAMALAAAFALLGAVLEGEKVFPTLGTLTRLSLEMSVVATLAAGISVSVMTYLGMPISSSHSIFGALVAVGLAQGRGLSTPTTLKILASMVTAPVGAGIVAYALYHLVGLAVTRLDSVVLLQRVIRFAAIAVGCYAAYALGANNVGNAMATVVAVGVVSPQAGALLGGLAIATGVLTFGHRVVMTVGKSITALDPVSALVAAGGTALTTHLFTQLAIPVSTSQAVVGAVVGVGLTKGILTVNRRVFWMVPLSWVLSVAASAALAYLLLAGYGALR